MPARSPRDSRAVGVSPRTPLASDAAAASGLGWRELGEAVQALAFCAGANSIFYGDRLLTTGNPDVADDRALLDKLGLSSA